MKINGVISEIEMDVDLTLTSTVFSSSNDIHISDAKNQNRAAIRMMKSSANQQQNVRELNRPLNLNQLGKPPLFNCGLNYSTIRALLEGGADPNETFGGESILHYIVDLAKTNPSREIKEIITVLIAHGAKTDVRYLGQDPISYCFSQVKASNVMNRSGGHWLCIEAFIENGTDPNCFLNFALDEAERGTFDFVNSLIKYNIVLEDYGRPLPDKGRGTYLPGISGVLSFAILKKDNDLVNALLKRGAKPTSKNICDSITAGMYDLIPRFMEMGAKIDGEDNYNNPVHAAILKRDLFALKLLKSIGANMKEAPYGHQQHLMFAIGLQKFSNEEIIKYLIHDCGNDPNLIDERGYCPLYIAYRNDLPNRHESRIRFVKAQCLLKNGARLDTPWPPPYNNPRAYFKKKQYLNLKNPERQFYELLKRNGFIA